MDNTFLMLRKMRYAFLAGQSIRQVQDGNIPYKSQRRPLNTSEILILCRIYSVLADRAWHEFAKILEIAGITKSQMKKYYDLLPLAESDTGKFLCLPNDNTPEIAPDEKGASK